MKKLLIFSMLPRDCVFEEETELQSVPITSVRAAILQCEYHCSRSSSAYPAELQKQQSKQQCPDPEIHPDFQTDSKMLPPDRHGLSSMSWVFLGASPQWDMLGTALSREPWTQYLEHAEMIP